LPAVSSELDTNTPIRLFCLGEAGFLLGDFQLFSGVRLTLTLWLFAFLVAALEKQRTGFVVVETSSAYREPLLLGVELQ
jgi:hypothetical protein